MTTVLSIQSSVAFGHVGNSAAAFPMMRRGVEVMPVLTVHFSNNTGYGQWRGPLLEPAQVADVIRGIDERGALADVDAVLTGYQGAPEMGEVVLEAVDRVRAHRPDAVWCCDPVLGDVDRGVYVRPGIEEFFRERAVPRADVLTPNLFELGLLTGRDPQSIGEVIAAARLLLDRGPGTVLVTSVETPDVPADEVGMLAVSGEDAWCVRTPRLGRTFTGSGDLTAALFLTDLLAAPDADLGLALERTAGSVHGVLAATDALDRRELALVAAQHEVVTPSLRVHAQLCPASLVHPEGAGEDD